MLGAKGLLSSAAADDNPMPYRVTLADDKVIATNNLEAFQKA